MALKSKLFAIILFALGGYATEAKAGWYCDVELADGNCITLCGPNLGFVIDFGSACTGGWSHYGVGTECPPRILATNPEVREPSVSMPWRYTKANFQKVLANTTKRRVSAIEIKQLYVAEQQRVKGVALPPKK